MAAVPRKALPRTLKDLYDYLEELEARVAELENPEEEPDPG